MKYAKYLSVFFAVMAAVLIAATAVACVIGAGFVSGQEVWQFFGADGWLGVLGIAIAVVLFGTGAAVESITCNICTVVST